MEQPKTYSLTKKEFKKLFKLSEKIYQICSVLDFYCKNNSSTDDIWYMTSITKHLRHEADNLYSDFFDIDIKYKDNLN